VVTGYGASVHTRTKASPALIVGRDDEVAQAEALVDALR